MRQANVRGNCIFYEDFVQIMSQFYGNQTRSDVPPDRKVTNGNLSATPGTSCSPSLSPVRLKELHVQFAQFDKDGDGRITADELLLVMTKLGFTVKKAEAQQMLQHADKDGNGSISFEEFTQLMETSEKSEQQTAGSLATRAHLKETFNVFDKDKDGFLNAADLRDTMLQLGIALTGDDLQAMMTSVGVGPRGKISYTEFCKMFSLSEGQKAKASGSNQHLATPRQKHKTDELKAVFALFDKDGDGFITVKEVTDVLISMGINPSPSRIEEIFRQVDLDGNDQIDFEEFLLLVKNYEKPLPQEREIRDMFNAIDKDHSGFVDASELKSTFVSLGIPLTDSDVQQMMRQANVRGNCIFYEDFVQIMSQFYGNQTGSDVPPDRKVTNGNLSATPSTSHSSSLSPVRLKELHVQFAQFDKDGDGRITADELLLVMTKLGFTIEQAEVKLMLQHADKDGNGTIDFDEFCAVMKQYEEKLLKANKTDSDKIDAKQVFKIFDKNSDGCIDELELQQTMKELGMTLTSDDIIAMFNEAGCQDSRRITYQEFVNMMTSGAANAVGFTPASVDNVDKAAEFTESVSLPSSPIVCLSTAPQLTCSTTAAAQTTATEHRHTPVTRVRSLVYGDERLKPGGTKVRKRSQSPPDTWKAFKVFDRNSDGYVSKSELYHTLKELGVNLSLDELNSKMKEADSNNDGRIDYAEFCSLMKGAFESFARQAALLHKQKSMTEKSLQQSVVDRSRLRQSMKNSFDEVDSNHDGRIDADELLKVSQTSGMKLRSKQHAVALINKYGNSQGNGTISFNEFKLIQAHCEAGRERLMSQKSRDAEQRMRTAFKVFDIDGNGFIDATELKSTLAQLGGQLLPSDADAMLEVADKNGDGQIDYEEFILMMYP
jgi:calmodulin